MEKIIYVTSKVAASSYAIHIKQGILKELTHYLPRELTTTVIVTNQQLARLYQDRLESYLPQAQLLALPEGENHKNLNTVKQIYQSFVAGGLDRKSVVISFGGGVIGDMAGFAAATYLRGVSFVQVPTSLLAMVDASVGGKLGVDLPEGKNLVGVFASPYKVLIDPELLQTLPTREQRCGLAEVLKHGLIADPGLLDLCLSPIKNWEAFIARALQVKVNLVQQDPYEQGVRAYLNLGHTFAHALEKLSNYTWLHGEAVAVGLVAAARLSARLKLCPPQLPETVQNLVAEVGLPYRLPRYPIQSLYHSMQRDKKWSQRGARYVLLKDIGQPVIISDPPQEEVLAVWESLQ